jgi:SP family arabinose:H+ symporter-like MFS transporter
LSVTEGNWRWMLGVQAIPAALYFLLLTLVPESPRWLIGKGRQQRAMEILRSVHGGTESQKELTQIQGALQEKKRRVSVRQLFDTRLRRVLFFGLGIAFFQQATGINAIFYYLPSIFTQAGGSLATSFGQSVLVGLVNVGMTFVAIWLIDRLGRKPLLCFGVAGMSVSLLCIGWAFHGADAASGSVSHPLLVLLAVVGFVASFAVSLGPVMWVLLSEIFPNEERAAAISVVGFWNSLISATVTLVFPMEIATFGPSFTFLCYGLIAVAGLVFILRLAPETKGKTLEELEGMLTRSSRTVT